jgi:high-affinity nickel-transport protein
MILSKIPAELRGRLFGMYGVLVAGNVLVWVWALAMFHDQPLLIGSALLAYSFGLRHAFDADHIAAIDNVTRKMMQEGRRPVGTGLFFSLGHSSVVLLLTLAIALGAAIAETQFDALKDIGGVVGTSISAVFLFLIAAANTVILVGVWKTFNRVRNGGAYDEADLDILLANRGFLARLFRGLFRRIGESWHMFPLGFLFGLGFDTATEVGLIGLSTTQAANGMSAWAVLVFPALFAAGMTLIDTTDSVLMLGAYGWAFVKPIRKLYYNLTITLVSVLVAVVVGGIEAAGLLVDQLDLKGGVWDVISMTNDNFGTLGYAIVGLFALAWLVSTIVYRVKRYDEIEVEAKA